MIDPPEPQLLAADNFTPVARTPWGGDRLRQGIKSACNARAERADQRIIGESWEVSVEPDFPAEIGSSGELLDHWLAADPARTLGEEARRGRSSTALLVKLLDTQAPLSVQIHPSDDYAGLRPGEAGKPETWYIVDAEPGAGLYLGFEQGVGADDVAQALRGERDFLPLLRFVPVSAGDFFVIDAGTPHAIGAGLTLVEPQHVLPGSRGLTYRYWDWDRLYDAQGRPTPSGSPRALHVADALAVTAWDRVHLDEFVPSIRHAAGAPNTAGPAHVEPLCGPTATLANDWLQVWRVHGQGSCVAPDVSFMRSLTVLEGNVRVRTPAQALDVPRGHSAVLPACAGACALDLSAAHAIVASVA